MKKFLSSTKGKIIAGAATLIVIAAVVVVVILLNTGYRSIRVENLDGTTKVTAESGVIEAFEGQNLKDGYKVRVLEDSSLTLALDSDKHVIADELTKFRIEAVGVAGKDSRTVIRLEKGSILNKIDNKLLPSESYVVESPNASMSVRGTIFTVNVFFDDEGFCHTLVEVEEGVVELTEKGTDNNDIKRFNAGDRSEVISLVDEEDDEKPTESSVNSSSDGGDSGGNGTYSSVSDFEYRKSSLGGIEILKYIGKEKIVNIPAEIDGKKVDKIGNGAFMRSEVTSVTIPDSVTEMGSNVFYSCIELTSINIPNGVKEIGTMAFDDCIALKSITIPDSVTEIGNSAFSGCASLTSIEIPESVIGIGDRAFYSCTELNSVKIQNGVKEIGVMAFWNCPKITSIEIPDSVTKIERGAFSGCKATIIYKGKTYTPENYSELYTE